MHTGHGGIICAAEWWRAKYLNHLLLLLITSKIRSCHYILEVMPKTLPTFRHVLWFPQSWIIRVLSAGLQSAVSGVWRGAVTLITAVSTLQQVCSACSTQLTFQRRGWWQRHVMSFCTRRQKQSWPGANALRTHAIAEYVTGQMSSRIADPSLSYLLRFRVEWSSVRCAIRDIQLHPSPVWLATGPPPAVLGIFQTIANIST